MDIKIIFCILIFVVFSQAELINTNFNLIEKEISSLENSKESYKLSNIESTVLNENKKQTPNIEPKKPNNIKSITDPIVPQKEKTKSKNKLLPINETSPFVPDFEIINDTIHTYRSCIFNCTIITEPGHYRLCDNINASHMDSASDICINIQSNDVYLDGQSFSIFGNSSLYYVMGKGIYSEGYANIHIDNINFNYVRNALLFWNCNNITIKNNIFTNNSNAILLESTNFNNIYNNKITYNFDSGIIIFNSTFNNISNNNLTNIELAGMYLERVDNTSIFENYINIANSGIFLTRIDLGNNINNEIRSNTIHNIYHGTIVVENSENTLIVQNLIDSSYYGIQLGPYLYNTTIEHNLIQDNYYGIANLLAAPGTYTNIRFNQINNNIRSGIIMSHVDHNIISQNDISGNLQNGIYFVRECNNNTVTLNNIIDNGEAGIKNNESMYNTFFGNNILNNEDNGIITSLGSYNMWENNTICFTTSPIDIIDADEHNIWITTTCDSSTPDGLCDSPC